MICLVYGIPGSGKSTFAKQLQQWSKNHHNEIIRSLNQKLLDGYIYDKVNVHVLHADNYIDNVNRIDNLPMKYSRDCFERAVTLWISPTADGVDNESRTTDDLDQSRERSTSQSSSSETNIQEGQTELVINRIRSRIERDTGFYCQGLTIPDINNKNLAVFNLIVIDDVFFYRSMRKPFKLLSRDLQMSYCEIKVECSVNVALERDRMRTNSDRVGDEVINKMNRLMELPETKNDYLLHHGA
ncbi:hypothetical protein GJ496_002095 [Pomphorhynchus laevis]|nr:hypothetical protein GJ496_002095 [Pomphorhynchus laevis]